MNAITALLPVKHYLPGYLREAIGSMFAQTSPDWRLLVIAEPDDVEHFRAVLAHELADPRVRLVANEGYRHAGAFNTGMRVAETEFVAILLADDLWAPRAVETLLANVAAFPDADVFHTGRQVVDDARNPISSIYYPPTEISLEAFVWTSLVKHLICWRRSKGMAVGGMDENLTTAGPDDYDFPWTMAEHGAKLKDVQECLYFYRDHRNGFRNTTHIPRSVHLRDIRYILTKHGVAPALIHERLRRAKRGYLRQCLYRNELDRKLKRWLGFDAQAGWRQSYTK